MAERIYIASLASVIAIDGNGARHLLGFVQNARISKTFNIEAVPEWGNYRAAELIVHSLEAAFSWTRAYDAGQDLVAQNLVPSDATIPQFTPWYLQLVDNRARRNIAMIYQGLASTYSIGADARTKLMQDVTGVAISMLLESEMQ